MALVTITIPNSRWTTSSSTVSWQPPAGSYVSLGTDLSATSGSEIFFAGLILRRTSGTNAVTLRLASSQSTFDPSSGGPDFSTEMEQNGTIAIVASNGDSLILSRINDSTEPYAWTPSNASEVYTFANTLAGLSDQSLTIAFNDAVVPYAEQTINLELAPNKGFFGSIIEFRNITGDPVADNAWRIDSSLTVSPETHFNRLNLYPNGRIIISLARGDNIGALVATSDGDFTSIFENFGTLTFSAVIDGTTHTLVINSIGFRDSTEPYDFTPANSAEVISFFNLLRTTDGFGSTATRTSFTLNLRQGDPLVSLTTDGLSSGTPTLTENANLTIRLVITPTNPLVSGIPVISEDGFRASYQLTGELSSEDPELSGGLVIPLRGEIASGNPDLKGEIDIYFARITRDPDNNEITKISFERIPTLSSGTPTLSSNVDLAIRIILRPMDTELGSGIPTLSGGLVIPLRGEIASGNIASSTPSLSGEILLRSPIVNGFFEDGLELTPRILNQILIQVGGVGDRPAASSSNELMVFIDNSTGEWFQVRSGVWYTILHVDPAPSVPGLRTLGQDQRGEPIVPNNPLAALLSSDGRGASGDHRHS